MTYSHLTQRTFALMATATITLGGLAIQELAFATEQTSQSSSSNSNQQNLLSQATLTWGIKQSFRDYIAKPFAAGHWSFDQVTENGGNFLWGQGKGTYDGTQGELAFPGTLSVQAHQGALDLKITNFRLKIQGSKGTILVDGSSKAMDGTVNQLNNTEFATVDLSTLQNTGNKLSLENAPVSLTKEGSKIFANMYPADQALDPLSLTAELQQLPASSAAPTPHQSASPSPTPTAIPSLIPSASSSANPISAPSNQPSLNIPTSASPTQAPQPTATNTASTNPGQSLRQVTTGNLSWSVKDSFLSYLTGPIAQGSWETGDGATYKQSTFTFSLAQGVYDPANQEGEFSFAGSLHFTGHQGKLDLLINNLRLQVKNGQGYLLADVTSRKLDGTLFNRQAIQLAAVDISNLQVTGSTISLNQAQVTLTTAGSEAFAGFYPVGTVLAPLTFQAELGQETAKNYNFTVTSPSQESSNSSTASSAPSSTQQAAPAPQATNLALPQQATTSHPTNLETCTPVTVTETITATPNQEKTNISAAQLNWGVKSSFRNYIAGGIANGGWDLENTTYSAGAFTWSSGQGNLENHKGSISFPGSLHFYGHQGVLDITLSEIRIDISGASGVLYAHVVSSDMQGTKKDYGIVPFADLDLSQLSVTDSQISIKQASATLRAEGIPAFANFYSIKETLDSLSFSGKLSKETNSAEVTTQQRTIYRGTGCDQLAHTGLSSATPSLVVGASLLLVSGASVLYVLARRRYSLTK